MRAFNMAMTSGDKYLPAYNWEPGMNDEVAYADRVTYATSVEMLTTGVAEDWGHFGSLEVGNPYDMDPMGEDRSLMTFPASDAKGMIGKMATASAGPQNTQTTVGGKSVASTPQTYNKVAVNKQG
jgi:hypothetical protein